MSVQPQIITNPGSPKGVVMSIADINRKIDALVAQGTNLPPGGVTGDRIAAQTITAAEIAAGTITATQIAAGTITASQIAAGTITASQIAAGTILAGNIAANAITTTQLAANSVTADKIAAGAITSYVFNGQSIVLSTGGTANVTIDTLGVRGTDATGTLKFNLDATTGLLAATGVLTLTSGSAVPAGVINGSLPGSANRYSNSTFQNGQGVFDATGWSLTNATIANGGTTVPPVYGALTAQVTATGGDISITMSPTTDSWRRVIPSLNYACSHYVYPTSVARQSRIDIKWYNSGGTLISTTAGTPVSCPLNAYTRVSAVAQAPAGAAYGTGVHYIALGAAASEVTYIDAFQMEQGDVPSAWAPRPDELLLAQVNAVNINVTNLAAISANLGTITAGTITGATVQTATGATYRTVLDGTGLFTTDSGGSTKVVSINGSTGITITGAPGQDPAPTYKLDFNDGSGNTIGDIYAYGSLVKSLTLDAFSLSGTQSVAYVQASTTSSANFRARLIVANDTTNPTNTYVAAQTGGATLTLVDGSGNSSLLRYWAAGILGYDSVVSRSVSNQANGTVASVGFTTVKSSWTNAGPVGGLVAVIHGTTTALPVAWGYIYNGGNSWTIFVSNSSGFSIDWTWVGGVLGV